MLRALASMFILDHRTSLREVTNKDKPTKDKLKYATIENEGYYKEIQRKQINIAFHWK